MGSVWGFFLLLSSPEVLLLLTIQAIAPWYGFLLKQFSWSESSFLKVKFSLQGTWNPECSWSGCITISKSKYFITKYVMKSSGKIFVHRLWLSKRASARATFENDRFRTPVPLELKYYFSGKSWQTKGSATRLWLAWRERKVFLIVTFRNIQLCRRSDCFGTIG